MLVVRVTGTGSVFQITMRILLLLLTCPLAFAGAFTSCTVSSSLGTTTQTSTSDILSSCSVDPNVPFSSIWARASAESWATFSDSGFGSKVALDVGAFHQGGYPQVYQAEALAQIESPIYGIRTPGPVRPGILSYRFLGEVRGSYPSNHVVTHLAGTTLVQDRTPEGCLLCASGRQTIPITIGEQFLFYQFGSYASPGSIVAPIEGSVLLSLDAILYEADGTTPVSGIQMVFVPEPSTWMFFAVGSLLCCLLRVRQ